MKSLIKFSSIFLLFAFACSICFADEYSSSYMKESKADRDQRMQWWREARFGMFIHWGLYAVPAGEWNGKTSYAEWIRHRAEIPRDVYDKFLPQFNPVKFDADHWVKMAKDAGMKYLVITSKHHDGFALYKSDISDYDVDATPFKRDILAELTEACKKHGVRMCFYYSIMDWHHPDYLPRRKWETWSAEGADFDKYISYMKEQLKEIITRYDPGVLWFDGEWESTWTHEEGLRLYDYVRSLKPDIIINNRVDKGRKGMQGMTKDKRFAGDFGTPEQEIPATGFPAGVDWESCMTMNHHWGWNKHDKDFKSTEDLIRKLVDIASKGGNFLLNIGPKADGTFPQESIDRLEEIGKWMEVNKKSIYGTTANPFYRLPWGRCTKKAHNKGVTLFLHVFDWPADGKLKVEGLKNNIKKAYLLANSQEIEFAKTDTGVTLHVPAKPICEIDTVIVLKINEPLKVEKIMPTQDSKGVVKLSAAKAAISNRAHGQPAKIETKNGKPNIGFWTDKKTSIQWDFRIKKSGKFDIKADLAIEANQSIFQITLNDMKVKGSAASTGKYDNFEVQTIGQTEYLEPGEYSLKIIPDKSKWKPINLRSLSLEPAK